VPALAAPPAARAEGSCGTGGATGAGVHVDFEESEYWAYVPAGAGLDRPLPLVVALHGDEGTPEVGLSYVWPDVWRARSDFILVLPRCPWESWWMSATDSARFVDRLVEHLLESYNVEMLQVYAWGFSGGGCFLGAYAEARQDVVAAVSHNVGGCYGGDEAPPVPGCHVPARLITGSADHQRDNVLQLAAAYERHGHEVDLHDIPGLDHSYHDLMFDPSVDWLMEHTLCGETPTGEGCGTSPDADGGPGDEGGTDDGGGADADAATPDDGGADTSRPDAPSPDSPPGDAGGEGFPDDGSLEGGCGCRGAGDSGPACPALLAFALVCLVRRRRSGAAER
jgi:hypothetical protein